MNDEFDQFEAELRALQPQRPSPELQARIAERLISPEKPPVNTGTQESQPVRSAFPRDFRGRRSTDRARVAQLEAAAVAVAGVAIVLWLLPRGGEQRAVAEPAATATAPVAVAFDDALPSVWQYHRALGGSADELEAVLDRHAGQARSEPPQYVQIRGFGRFNRELNDLWGEI